VRLVLTVRIVLELSAVVVLLVVFALLTLLVAALIVVLEVGERDLLDELSIAAVVVSIPTGLSIAAVVPALITGLEGFFLAAIVEAITSLMLELLARCLAQSSASLRDLEHEIG